MFMFKLLRLAFSPPEVAMRIGPKGQQFLGEVSRKDLSVLSNMGWDLHLKIRKEILIISTQHSSLLCTVGDLPFFRGKLSLNGCEPLLVGKMVVTTKTRTALIIHLMAFCFLSILMAIIFVIVTFNRVEASIFVIPFVLLLILYFLNKELEKLYLTHVLVEKMVMGLLAEKLSD